MGRWGVHKGKGDMRERGEGCVAWGSSEGMGGEERDMVGGSRQYLYHLYNYVYLN